MKIRLGLMGGTFDPVHFGHLRIAEAARETLALERVIFVPNKTPVHKPGRTVSPAEDRQAMVELAVAGNPAFCVSRVEIDRPGPSYAIDTVRFFYSPSVELVWIVGADTVPLLPTWHAARELASLCTFAGVPRPGYDHLSVPDGFRVEWIAAPGLDISASGLRERVREGRSIRYLLPASVEDYLTARRLYQHEPSASTRL